MTLGYSFSQYFVQIIAGLGTGAVLFLVSAGLTLVFGALRVVNFAHGSMTMLGAFVGISLIPAIGFGNATFWIVLILAGLIIAAGGLFMEVLFFRPIYNRPLLAQLLVTFAFVLIIAGVQREVWGAPTRQVTAPPFVQGGVDILGGAIPKYNFFFMAVAVAVGVALWALLYRTGLGRMIRAAVSDPTLLGLSGVNVRRLFSTVLRHRRVSRRLRRCADAPARLGEPRPRRRRHHSRLRRGRRRRPRLAERRLHRSVHHRRRGGPRDPLGPAGFAGNRVRRSRRGARSATAGSARKDGLTWRRGRRSSRRRRFVA